MEKEQIAQKGPLSAYISPDPYPDGPDRWGDDGVFLVADHRDFYVKPPKDSTMESVVADYQKTHHVFGLEAYIHSGVVLALSREGNFPDRQWDVSQLGAVFVAKNEARTKAKAREMAQGLIETWNTYLSGDVWTVSVEDETDEVIECVGGFYGRECAEEEARDMLEASLPSYLEEQQKVRSDKSVMSRTLADLLEDKDTTISRHALGILKAAKKK